MIARRSLGSTVLDTPFTAVSAPKLWVRFRISRRGRFSVISPLVIFGHLTAQLVRRAASLRTAHAPRRRLGSPIFRSFHRSPRRRSGASARNATERADDPPGREEHEQDERQSEDEHPSLRVGADEALEQKEGRGTQPTAEERARPADDHHQERLAR